MLTDWIHIFLAYWWALSGQVVHCDYGWVSCSKLKHYFPTDQLHAPKWLLEAQHREWATLGFLRGVCATPKLCRALSSPPWVNLLLHIASGASATPAELSSHVLLPTQVRAYSTIWKKLMKYSSLFSFRAVIFNFSFAVIYKRKTVPVVQMALNKT